MGSVWECLASVWRGDLHHPSVLCHCHRLCVYVCMCVCVIVRARRLSFLTLQAGALAALSAFFSAFFRLPSFGALLRKLRCAGSRFAPPSIFATRGCNTNTQILHTHTTQENKSTSEPHVIKCILATSCVSTTQFCGLATGSSCKSVACHTKKEHCQFENEHTKHTSTQKKKT